MMSETRKNKLGLVLPILILLCLAWFDFTSADSYSNDSDTIIINEIAWMGTEASWRNEWFEFFNLSTSTIDISNWSIYGARTGNCLNFSEADGYATTNILPQDYLVYGYKETIEPGVQSDIWDTSIGLNNSNPGEIRLFSEPSCPPDGALIDLVDNKIEGDETTWLAGDNNTKHTMARKSDGTWTISQKPGGTPGQINFIQETSTTSEEEKKEEDDDDEEEEEEKDEKEKEEDKEEDEEDKEEDESDKEDDSSDQEKEEKEEDQTETEATTEYPFFSIEEVRDLPEQEKISTKGRVAVLPGVLGKQYFYITNSSGLQIYNFHRAFPDLTRGDLIKVKGRISISRGEKRINTSNKSDIEILSSGNSPTANKISCQEVSEKIGSLVTVQGQVTDINSSANRFYLNDTTDEVLIFLPEKIDFSLSELSSGYEIKATGLINRYDDLLRILPRDQKDLEIISTSTKDNFLDLEIKNGSETKQTKEINDYLVINEIFPNSSGDDKDHEFIELYNLGEDKIDLSGWKIENKLGQTFEFGLYPSLYNLPKFLGPEEFLVIPRAVSYLVLNDNQEVLKLIDPEGEIKQKISYTKSPVDFSYCNTKYLNPENLTTSTKLFLLHSFDLNDWVWSQKITPGEFNQIKTINREPIVDFSYPAEIIIGQPAYFDSSDTIDPDGDSLTFSWEFGDGVKVDLASPHHTFLTPGERQVSLKVSDGQTEVKKIANVLVKSEKDQPLDSASSQDQVEIEDEKDQAIEEVNSLAKAENTESHSSKTSSPEFEATDIGSNSEADKIKKIKNIPFFPLEEIRNLPEDKQVTTQGKVAVLPGVLGKQYFYIVGSPGLQVYNFHGAFPDLAIGDLIQVVGKTSISRGEKRINTSDKDDIKILSSEKPPTPSEIECQAVPTKIGNLVTIQGQVTEKGANRFYLDDYSDEVLVFLQDEFDFSLASISEGDELMVTGLVNQYGSMIRVMPRDKTDIKAVVSSAETSEDNLEERSLLDETGNEKRVLGDSTKKKEFSSDNNLKLSSRAKTFSWPDHITKILFIIIIILLIVLIKEQRLKK